MTDNTPSPEPLSAMELYEVQSAIFNALNRDHLLTRADFSRFSGLLPRLIAQARTAVAAEGELAEVLTMTECKDATELQDMANIGRSFMERMASVITTDGPFKGWAPADDPAELVIDLVNALDEALASPAIPDRESVAQEPKYRFDGGRVYNRASGEVIPLDEPVFVFRARDRHAEDALHAYHNMVADEHHADVVYGRIQDFRMFKADHPERMKEPDSEISTPVREG